MSDPEVFAPVPLERARRAAERIADRFAYGPVGWHVDHTAGHQLLAYSATCG